MPRGEIFVTSKFWPQFGAPENVEICLDLVLKDLGLDYIDLFLVHWPVVFKARPNILTAKAFYGATNGDRGIASNDNDEKPAIDWAHSPESTATAHGEKGSFKRTWQALQELVQKGKVRAIGVSNFSIAQLQEVLSIGGPVPLSCNQIESHPYFPNSPLLDFMHKENILATAYCPFAGAGLNLLEDPTVVSLAQKNHMDVGQLLQSWALQRGTIPLGKSQREGELSCISPPKAKVLPPLNRI